MQPFDHGSFDKRYESVFAPAIANAGLEPYRVDKDPAVDIPIESIEAGILSAQLCFAEITTDNPNVWFELGFAMAAQKDVVMVCSNERKTDFPFDVRHRSIITYGVGAPQDFEALRVKITERIRALIEKGGNILRAASLSPLKNATGLSQLEIVGLVTVAQNEFVTGGMVFARTIRQDMDRAGFTEIAAKLALTQLMSKKMVTREFPSDEDGEQFVAYALTEAGESWLVRNQDQLVLRKDPYAVPF